jgi:hypothetical protein
MRRTLVIVPAALAVVLALAGCSASGGASSAVGRDTSGQSATAPDSGGTADSAAGTGSKAGDTADTAAGGSSDRRQVVTGTLGLTADDPLGAATKAAALVTAAGGRIDGRTETAATDHVPASASLVLRIPVAKFDTTVDRLQKLGTHPDLATKAEDVTGQSRDLDARIHALQGTIARFQQLETTAAKTEDLLAIEKEIGDRQAELESLQSQQRALGDQVSMSTLTLNLAAPGVAPSRTGPQDFGTAVATGWAVFAGVVSALVLAFGVMLPWIVLFGLLGGGLWIGLRWRRRRAQSAARISASSAKP